MKLNYLFPHRYKKIGWIILIPTFIAGLATLSFEIEPDFFDMTVFAIYLDGLIEGKRYFSLLENNVLDEILGVLMIISATLVAFSKEPDEDEFISKVRLESLVWAICLNYAVLFLAILLVYELAFLWVMIVNMFTVLLIFIARFNWLVWKFKKSVHEE